MGLTVAAEIIVGSFSYVSDVLEFKYYMVREKMVVQACVEFLALRKGDSSMIENVYEQLTNHLRRFQFKENSHSKLFERCVMASLCQMTKGKKLTVSELPILSEDSIGIENVNKLPQWTKEVEIDIESYGTAREHAFQDDLNAIESMITSSRVILLMPLNFMGQDAISVLHYKEKLFLVSISVKMYVDGVPWKEHLKSLKTTDYTWSYSQEDGDKLAKAKAGDMVIDKATLKDLYKQIQLYFKKTDKTDNFLLQFDKSKVGGVLRIHVEWTHPQGFPDLKCIVTDDGQVLVWITMNNIQHLLPELVEILSGYLAKDVFERREAKRQKNV